MKDVLSPTALNLNSEELRKMIHMKGRDSSRSYNYVKTKPRDNLFKGHQWNGDMDGET